MPRSRVKVRQNVLRGEWKEVKPLYFLTQQTTGPYLTDGQQTSGMWQCMVVSIPRLEGLWALVWSPEHCSLARTELN